MSLKIAVSGKGGVGKSTLCATLALLFARDSYQVLAIDADPDANLASALGIPAQIRDQIHTISQEKQLIEERTGAKAAQYGQIFSLNPDVSGIAERYGVLHQGVQLVVLGAVQRAGGGCACPESVLLKTLVRDIVLNRNEMVLLDMEAGIEHLGRGTAMGVDVTICVIEPGRRSIETALRIREMSHKIGIQNFAVVLNKTTEPDSDIETARENFPEDDILGIIPYCNAVIEADRLGKSLLDMDQPELIAPFMDIKTKLEERYQRK